MALRMAGAVGMMGDSAIPFAPSGAAMGSGISNTSISSSGMSSAIGIT